MKYKRHFMLTTMVMAIAAVLLFANTSTGAFYAAQKGTPVPTPAPVDPSEGVARNADWTPVIETFGGVQMVLVPAGCFMMGSTPDQIEAAFELCVAARGTGVCQIMWFEDEQPAQEVCFEQPFWIDRIEVTNGQFAQFSGQAERAGRWTDAARPRELITWFEAQDFCALRGARLPTEAEWEYAARGPDGLIFPWGDSFVPENVVYDQSSGSQTANVGSRPGGASWVGALDLSGNVFEWTADCYAPPALVEGDFRTLRGGSYAYEADHTRAAARDGVPPDTSLDVLGFRCARDY
jgi:formylglycine-generating enzyme required for sulfatase activity